MGDASLVSLKTSLLQNISSKSIPKAFFSFHGHWPEVLADDCNSSGFTFFLSYWIATLIAANTIWWLKMPCISRIRKYAFYLSIERNSLKVYNFFRFVYNVQWLVYKTGICCKPNPILSQTQLRLCYTCCLLSIGIDWHRLLAIGIVFASSSHWFIMFTFVAIGHCDCLCFKLTFQWGKQTKDSL